MFNMLIALLDLLARMVDQERHTADYCVKQVNTTANPAAHTIREHYFPPTKCTPSNARADTARTEGVRRMGAEPSSHNSHFP